MTLYIGALILGLIVGLVCYFGEKPAGWSWRSFFTCLDIGLLFAWLLVQLAGHLRIVA